MAFLSKPNSFNPIVTFRINVGTTVVLHEEPLKFLGYRLFDGKVKDRKAREIWCQWLVYQIIHCAGFSIGQSPRNPSKFADLLLYYTLPRAHYDDGLRYSCIYAIQRLLSSLGYRSCETNDGFEVIWNIH
ncbi:hypothetical protein GEMRC1_002365 [Eukaryota sp. GEM-RC1]